MNTEKEIESTLERIGEAVSLRTDEKALHRENLLAFMEKSRTPVRSPYAWFTKYGSPYAAALLLLIMVSGGGAVSAETSKPGDALYVMKLKVTEPVRSLLTFNQEDKTEFELERTDRRLKEFALVAASENPDPETTALITESLMESISDVNEDIQDLATAGETGDALKTNADLQSVLTAHSLVLDAVGDRNPSAAEDVAKVSASVDAGIASTENAEGTIEDSLAPSLSTDTPVTESADDTETALAALRTQVTEGVALLDASDQATVTEHIATIDSIVAEARTARSAGNREEAFLLYTEAGQRLNELQTLIEADRDLGIGVIDAENTSSITD